MIYFFNQLLQLQCGLSVVSAVNMGDWMSFFFCISQVLQLIIPVTLQFFERGLLGLQATSHWTDLQDKTQITLKIRALLCSKLNNFSIFGLSEFYSIKETAWLSKWFVAVTCFYDMKLPKLAKSTNIWNSVIILTRLFISAWKLHFCFQLYSFLLYACYIHIAHYHLFQPLHYGSLSNKCHIITVNRQSVSLFKVGTPKAARFLTEKRKKNLHKTDRKLKTVSQNILTHTFKLLPVTFL